MRVRIALAVAIAAVAVGLALDMSRGAPRMAGSNHIGQAAFADVVPGGGELCQPESGPPPDSASAHLLIGTYGRELPVLEMTFLSKAGAIVASGRRPAGGPQGLVSIPLSQARGEAVRSCLHVDGRDRMAFAGEGQTSMIGTSVDGKGVPGRVSLTYYRPGSESWWQLLPTLTTRFGLGKAFFFGDWTLPVMALLLLAVWVAALRLLLRELR
ncbi:MAG TPA: hypothetical protein VGG08_00985 [Solirubrobacteraceae bacterium]